METTGGDWELTWLSKDGQEGGLIMEGDRAHVQEKVDELVKELGVPVLARRNEYMANRWGRHLVCVESFMVFTKHKAHEAEWDEPCIENEEMDA